MHAPERTRRSFTLIEIIIAISLFAIIAALGTSFFAQTSRIYKRITLQNELLNEAEFIMERLRQMIAQNTIDYEEYYSHAMGTTNYGQNYGDYGALFYDSSTGTERATGKNAGINAIDAYAQDELYLINSMGDQKIIIGREKTGTDTDGSDTYAIALAKMSGTDSGDDGIPDIWTCTSDFNCTGTATIPTDSIPDPSDWTDTDTASDKDFIPITPSNIAITSLTFYVSPLEDPRKAFAEKDPSVVIQPHVTIVMTAALTQKTALGTYGLTPSIELETTVSSRVYNEVTSYVSS